MHRDNEYIGCLSGVITKVGNDLTGAVSLISGELSASVTRVGKGLSGTISIICTTNRDSYLRVTPDTVWLTPDMISGEFDIYSNVIWQID